MTNIWVASDHHFGHKNILNFTDRDGNKIRGAVFENIMQHDEAIIEYHNALVKPEDHVYFLGDLAITKRGIECASRMNGHKRLVRGNHDIFKTKVYQDHGIPEIYGVRVFTDAGYIFSHIPLHPDSLGSRGWTNIHGHLHQNIVLLPDDSPDSRYRCVSLEHTDYKPILLMR